MRSMPAGVQFGIIFLFAVPWLWPLSIGPYAEAIPWLFSLGVSGLLLLLWPKGDITQTLALAWGIAAVLGVFPGLLQYFGMSHIDLFWPWIRNSAPGYASGNIGQPNQQSTFLAIGLISLHWFLRTGGARWWIYFSTAFITLGMAATASRIGAMHIIVVSILAVLWSKDCLKSVLPWCLIVVTSYAMSALLLPELADQFGIEGARSLWSRIQSAEASCGSRRLLWSNVLELIQARPWFGWGWGDLRYAQYITLFEGPRWCAALGNAHNFPLHLAVTLGIPAALFICTLILALVIREKPWRERNTRRQLAWSVLVLIGFHSLVEYPIWYGPFQIAVAVSLYILWKNRHSFSENNDKQSASLNIWRLGFGILMITGSACIFIDYWRVSQPYLDPQYRIEKFRGKILTKETLDYASETVIFQNQALFARLLLLSPDADNALIVNRISSYLLHFAPEPRVLEKLLDSLLLLHDHEQLRFHMVRFKAAFPAQYVEWERSRFPLGEAESPLFPK